MWSHLDEAVSLPYWYIVCESVPCISSHWHWHWQLAAILVSQSKHLAAADFVMHMLCFQLIRECKDVLYAATLVKQYYQFMVDPVMLDEQEAEEKFAADLDQFDQDLRSMLEVGCCCLSVCYCS